MEPAQISVGAQIGLLRHSADPPAEKRDDPGRRRRGRRVVELRQHAVRAAGSVLQRPAVAPHHRLAQRADAALRAGAADAGRGHQPDVHRRRPHRQGSRRRDGLWRHLRAHPGRGVLRTGRNQDAGKDGARPVLRRRGPRPHRLPGMRLLHDGLSLRRQEHVPQALPRPRRIGWGASHSDDDGKEFPAAPRPAVGGRNGSHRQLGAPRPTHLHREPPDPGRRHLGDAAPAVQDARQGTIAASLNTFGRVDPDQLGVDRRRRTVGGQPGSGPDARRGDHVVDSPDAGHPHRTRPLRQGLQRHGAVADADDRRPRPARVPMCRAGGSCSTPRERIRARCCGCSTPAAGANAR